MTSHHPGPYVIATTDREAMPGSRRFSHRSCFREWLYGTPGWNPGEIVLAARFGDQRIPIRTETSDDGMRRFRPSTEAVHQCCLSVIEPSAATTPRSWQDGQSRVPTTGLGMPPKDLAPPRLRLGFAVTTLHRVVSDRRCRSGVRWRLCHSASTSSCSRHPLTTLPGRQKDLP